MGKRRVIRCFQRRRRRKFIPFEGMSIVSVELLLQFIILVHSCKSESNRMFIFFHLQYVFFLGLVRLTYRTHKIALPIERYFHSINEQTLCEYVHALTRTLARVGARASSSRCLHSAMTNIDDREAAFAVL